MKKLLLTLVSAAALFTTSAAQEKTTLSAEIYGYKGNTVYFDCI